MKYIKALIFFIIKFLAILLGAYALFFIFFVIPNDKRVKEREIPLNPIAGRRKITHDLIALSSKAIIRHEEESLFTELAAYPFINNNRDFHTIPENMHLSLGWYPLKMVHKNCLYAPTSTSIRYRVTLPALKPQLLFSCGVLDRQAEFQVYVRTADGSSRLVFEKNILPLTKYLYRYTDKFYKQFLQYVDVQMAERDSRWQDFSVDLSAWAGQAVEITFMTNGNAAQAFWANPLITAEDKEPDFKYNLLLIVMDSLGRTMIGPQANGKSVTPYLDSLSKEAMCFEHHLANGNMTKQSVSSFLSSRLPFELGDVSLEYVAGLQSKHEFYRRKFPTLASVLNGQGYVTGAIGVISLFTDGAGFGVDVGFNDARIMERFGYSNVYITNEAISWLQQYGNMPFALMVYYDSAHGPYKPPLHFLWKTKSQFAQFDAQNWYKTLYAGTVSYNDAYIGKLLEALQKLGLKENTLVAVTSDHAENLQWHPLPDGKGKAVFHDHGISLKNEDIHVPLIVRFPLKNTTPLRVDAVTEHLDLAPTLLDFLDIPVPSDFRGKSLEPMVRGEKIAPKPALFIRGRFNKGVLLQERYKYIRNFGVYERRGHVLQDFIPEELYDMTSDPAESNNIVENDYQLRSLARETLDSFEPDPQRNFFTFCNMGENKGEVSISARGIFENVSLEGKGSPVVSGNVLKVRLSGRKTVVSFDTNPYNAPLTIKIMYNGNPYPLSNILVSADALRLLSDVQKEIGGNDFYLCAGKGEISNEIPGEFAVYWTRAAHFKTEWEKQQGVGGVFKQVLAEWGYLSEPAKK